MDRTARTLGSIARGWLSATTQLDIKWRAIILSPSKLVFEGQNAVREINKLRTFFVPTRHEIIVNTSAMSRKRTLSALEKEPPPCAGATFARWN